jgi:hypothetical protein
LRAFAQRCASDAVVFYPAPKAIAPPTPALTLAEAKH